MAKFYIETSRTTYCYHEVEAATEKDALRVFQDSGGAYIGYVDGSEHPTLSAFGDRPHVDG